MSTIDLNLTTLPLDTKKEIIEQLDLRSIAILGQTDHQFKTLTDSLLLKIVQKIQSPSTQGSPIQQIKRHVEELYAKADELKDNRIKSLLDQPKTLKNVSFLQKFLKARDILILWNELLPNAPKLDQLKTCNDVIENADGFSAAFNQDKEQYITNTTYLSLVGESLTHIPLELFELSNLTHLYLHRNMLTEIPDEIGNLKNLTSLSLSENALKTLPSQITTLKVRP
ncbi:MAG: hypothetical protein K1000chlam2_00181 [Chlamydiae bacterium]|nr:hypothetical protein [Chlamydiota bacterium]